MALLTAWKSSFETAINRIERAMGSTRNGNATPMHLGAALPEDIAIVTAMAVRTGHEPPRPRMLPKLYFDVRAFQAIMLSADVRRNGHVYWSLRLYGSSARASRPRVHDAPRVR